MLIWEIDELYSDIDLFHHIELNGEGFRSGESRQHLAFVLQDPERGG